MGQCGSSHSGDFGSLSRSVGTKKALIIGINYKGKGPELRGCINDAKTQKALLMERFDFHESEIRMLTEDEPKERWPNKSAILEGMRWLYEGAAAGHLCFFHYSGHGSQTTVDGQICDCICPLDCVCQPWPAAVITDFEIHRLLFDPLPDKVKCVAVFDCCHSGTVANLTVQRGWNPLAAAPEERPRYMEPPKEALPPKGTPVAVGGGVGRALVNGKYIDHELWVLSGCQDSQTSADAFESGQFCGAFTWALDRSLREDSYVCTYIDLLAEVKSTLKRKFTQVPALTTTNTAYLSWYFLGKEPVTRALTEVPATHKKALLVGCNYRGKGFELKGCINDVLNQKRMLQDKFGFKEADMLVLTEDECKENWPTKARIQEGLQWLVEGASEGDHLFFHFSGHGSQITDRTGHEPSGMSDVICPLDCDQPWPAHVILDTELHTDLYDHLPNGVRLECVFDCCHSGTIADLDQTGANLVNLNLVAMVPQEYSRPRYLPPPQAHSQPGSPSASASALSTSAFTVSCVRPAEGKRASGFRKAAQKATQYKDKLLFVYSGCQDSQTSADAFEEGQHQGAFTWAFLKALEHKRYCVREGQLLLKIREVLAPHYKQVPALSTTSADNFQRFFMGQQTPLGSGLPSCSR